jgi:excisionase family DNA binding protein
MSELLRRSSPIAVGVRVKTETPPPSPAGVDKLLNAKQVAERLQVHVATVYRLAEAGRLEAMRLGAGEKRRRGFRCWESAVDAYLGESVITSTDAPEEAA